MGMEPVCQLAGHHSWLSVRPRDRHKDALEVSNNSAGYQHYLHCINGGLSQLGGDRAGHKTRVWPRKGPYPSTRPTQSSYPISPMVRLAVCAWLCFLGPGQRRGVGSELTGAEVLRRASRLGMRSSRWWGMARDGSPWTQDPERRGMGGEKWRGQSSGKWGLSS